MWIILKIINMYHSAIKKYLLIITGMNYVHLGDIILGCNLIILLVIVLFNKIKTIESYPQLKRS